MEVPLAVVRRVLAYLIAAALALAPLGVASAAGTQHARAPMAFTNSAHQSHAAQHDHGMMHGAAMHDAGESQPCKHESGKGCCDDKAACAQTCLVKCFGQMAVLAEARTERQVATHTFIDAPTERPPDWSAAPQPPPPRV